MSCRTHLKKKKKRQHCSTTRRTFLTEISSDDWNTNTGNLLIGSKTSRKVKKESHRLSMEEALLTIKKRVLAVLYKVLVPKLDKHPLEFKTDNSIVSARVELVYLFKEALGYGRVEPISQKSISRDTTVVE